MSPESAFRNFFAWKYKPFREIGWDTISLISFFPKASACYVTVDPLTIREILTYHGRFIKSTENSVLDIFGPNIVSTEGHEWKRHRRITAPTFSERNNRLVWDETMRILDDMFDAWGRDTPDIFTDNVLEITKPITLLVISAAAFGRRISWVEDKQVFPGHKVSFTDCMQSLSGNLLLILATPKFAYRFSKKLQFLQQCKTDMLAYMHEMIANRREYPEMSSQADLLGALLDSEAEDPLTDEELIGDIFIYLIAGHETTSHMLCYTFALLALDQEEQEKLYQNIASIIPKNETLVLGLPRYAAEDTTIPTVGPDGNIVTLPVAKGCMLFLDLPGALFNERYWKDPYVYRPSRFLEPYNRDVFLPFSSGPRACLGRRFAETEGVAAITTIISKYKVDLKNPEAYEGLTYLEKREKLLGVFSLGITVAPGKIPLVFRKRT
ncbi:hypothetical protein M422DRAFT_241924 [Sphaerobolus stellatus SS14]|nr:hypothetical protein M422DRAFT_241924 [Sphaerobolus stellatus SS14]